MCGEKIEQRELDRQLLAMAKRLIPAAQRLAIRRFICDGRESKNRAVAQAAERRALNPRVAVRIRAAQVV